MEKEKRLALGDISRKNIPTKISFVNPNYRWKSEEYHFSHTEKGNAVYVKLD